MSGEQHEPAPEPPPTEAVDSRFLMRFIGKGGRVLAEVTGLAPRYIIRGDEGYVRASINDSNGRRAWTQPVFVAREQGDLFS